MNKKIKIYSLILLLVIIVSALSNTLRVEHSSSVQKVGEQMELVDYPSDIDFSHTSANGDTTYRNYSKWMSYTVNVVANNFEGRKVLVSKVFDQTCEVNLQKVELKFPVSNTTNEKGLYGVFVGLYICLIAIALWIFYIIFKTIRSIRKGEIFVTQVSKNLEKIGIILCVIYLVQWLGSYIITQYIIYNIHLAYHSVVYKNESNIMFLIMGLSLMVVSQIILMGKDLKEENDLTI